MQKKNDLFVIVKLKKKEKKNEASPESFICVEYVYKISKRSVE